MDDSEEDTAHYEDYRHDDHDNVAIGADNYTNNWKPSTIKMLNIKIIHKATWFLAQNLRNLHSASLGYITNIK